ncbi:2-hydroxyacyl-CoA dehydratase [Rhodococcus wratislaviensis]|uniref:2-hydroxyacyl-CoA dehydratase n=1 Tax=Rhodococcus wratislaviensis TaxID=44752 RepID=UPI003513EE4D
MTGRRIESAERASAYHKQWFAAIRERAADGDPLALVNADAPQEILRAMDIPYVVNQWWAALVGAKRLADHSLDAVRALGYPDDSRQYDAIALGSTGLASADAPWGGLPRPTIVIAENSGDAGRKVFDLWGEYRDTEVFLFERTTAHDAPHRWWELVPRRWSEAFDADRLDLMVAENWLLVDKLERITGRTLSLDRLAEVMDLVNQQAEWNRRSRDILASARPTPVSVHESINSVMIPQWHRGTQWAVDAAERFCHEVEAAAASGRAVCPGERVRLMWVGRGLWFDMDLYERFQQRYGAVFVWSMYLAIAADGYPRYGGDPMRALAARFTGFTDQLYMPGWAADWYVKEARGHGVDGVIHLVADDVPGPYFVTRALEEAGIPVLEIRGNNADPRALNSGVIGQRIEEFIASRFSR